MMIAALIAVSLILLRTISCSPVATPTDDNNTVASQPEEEDTVVEGDMMNFEPKVLVGSAYKSGLLLREYLWNDAKMYYRFNSTLDKWTRKNLRAAMMNIEKHTCIRFVMLTPEMTGEVDEFYEIFPAERPDICKSSVGLICKDASLNCRHKMEIGEKCELGRLVHELMHALGFVHEQSRPDRDDFVVIHYDNIKKSQIGNFNKYTYPLRQLTPYDIESIMHYNTTDFADLSKGAAKKTIEAKVPLPDGVEIGQRWKLSKYDIVKLNGLYNCTVKEALKTKAMLQTNKLEEGGAKLEV